MQRLASSVERLEKLSKYSVLNAVYLFLNRAVILRNCEAVTKNLKSLRSFVRLWRTQDDRTLRTYPLYACLAGRQAIRYTLIFLLAFTFGCAEKPITKISNTQAQAKFNSIIEEELNIPFATNQAGQTFWVYIPVEENFFVYKASPMQGSAQPQPTEKPTLKYIAATFNDPNFIVEYDISLNKTYAKDPGYKTDYSDDFKKKQQIILSALQRAFTDSEEAPRFVVMVITDIKNGVEMENLIFLDDLMKAMSAAQVLPQEEFAKRYVTDFRGDTKAVGDKVGKHINYRDIPMTEFLSRQIENRVKFKYQQSAFSPSADTNAEVRKAAEEALKAYKFEDYKEINVRDLSK